MAKVGTMPVTNLSAPLAGVPHMASKVVDGAAPKASRNMLNVRVAPLKRLQAQVKPIKPDKPNNIGNF